MPTNFKPYIEKLSKGEIVQFRPVGNSMVPKIYSKQLVTVSPDVSCIEIGDILLCKVKGTVIVHLVTALQGDMIQISNNKGYVNGWTTKDKVYGKVIKIEN